MEDTSKPRSLPTGSGGNKKVVTLLAKFERYDSKIVSNKTKKTCVYKCPNQNCTLPNNEIVFSDKSGFTNPLAHLKMCLSRGDIQHFASYYWSKADALESGRKMQAYFPLLRQDVVPEESRDIMNWIQLIVLKSLPVNIVVDPHFRSFHASDKRHSKEKIKQIMFKLCEYVEKMLAEEMESSGRGTIMHDGWSKFGTHFWL